MREIKFRAWDKIEGKMWRPIVGHDGVLMASNQLGGYVSYPANQDPLMQYTGLKDKNGVEIYEGDVVYLAGHGEYECEFPFIELYEAQAELDVGGILGNIHENPELMEK
jgi:uncharacterized phage protein (TIGR01671 family)